MKSLTTMLALVIGLVFATASHVSHACGDIIKKPTKPGTGTGGPPKYQW